MNLAVLPVIIPLGTAFLLAGVHRLIPTSLSRVIAALAALASCVISIRLTDACESFFFRNSRTLMSFNRFCAYKPLDANHLEFQSDAMPRRKPTGLTF